jgi:hypothetical protein
MFYADSVFWDYYCRELTRVLHNFLFDVSLLDLKRVVRLATAEHALNGDSHSTEQGPIAPVSEHLGRPSCLRPQCSFIH